MSPPVSSNEHSPLISNNLVSASPTFNTENDQDDRAEAESQSLLNIHNNDSLPDEAPDKSHVAWIVAAVSVGIFLAALDSTITITSYAHIGNDLNALNLTSWIATAYFLSLTSFQTLYGRLSDVFGTKECLLFAYVVFGFGTVMCGFSQNIYQLIIARAFQGIGGGGMTTMVSIVISNIVPLKDRGVWQGITNVVYAFGSSSGAALGGVLSDLVGWRWIFWAQSPLCVVAVLAVSLLLKLPPNEEEQESIWIKLKKIDFPGAILLVSTVFCLLFGMDRGSNVDWGNPISYFPLAISLLLFIAFIIVELRVARYPFTPGRIIFDRNLIPCYLCYFFSFGSWAGVQYYLPLFYQAVDKFTASRAAILWLPAIFAGVLGSLTGGFVMKKSGKYYRLVVISYIVMAVGIAIALLFMGIAKVRILGISVGIILVAFGNGVGMTGTLTSLIANAAPEDQAIAIACTYLFRSLGNAMSISLGSAVIQQSLRSVLGEALGNGKEASTIEKGVRESLNFIDNLQPEIQNIVRHSYSTAIRHEFVLMLILASLAIISSFWMREKSLNRQ